jgi:hypothetical protein
MRFFGNHKRSKFVFELLPHAADEYLFCGIAVQCGFVKLMKDSSDITRSASYTADELKVCRMCSGQFSGTSTVRHAD